MDHKLYSIILGITKRLGDGPLVDVATVRWTAEDLPSRSLFFETIEQAYESIELPYFPAAAWVEISTAVRNETIAVSEPVDEPEMIGIALWNGIVTASTGYG